ncbi:GNAT family N-acetyltransferase [Corallococcus exercitus]|uniref:GNAT family N-acetyltransferase n=1 Tax=Corallococcus exercitus TaxID=2316736 RepID=A0A7Y4JME4_9BACT|nr:GNAT family N-acetyltransferase [Corallococcus exercitus]NOK07744.1 GNAT family N-acetyltransferase [Corallococcus exercitus]
MSTELTLRPIEARDDAAMAAVIRAVMPEFGADGPGFAIHDPEVDAMSTAYSRPRHVYFVVEHGGQVVGGAGIAPLDGGAPDVCELRKMYFLPKARGHGMGERLLRHCLEFARSAGFKQCYLETLGGMEQAQKLYRKVGFEPLCAPMGRTGHFGCDRWYAMNLTPPA